MNNKVLAIIPARGGSKGIPRKNIRPFLGKPLIEYSIKLALSCKEIDKVIVTTDDEEIAEVALKYGADVVPQEGVEGEENVNIPYDLSKDSYLKSGLNEIRKKRFEPEHIIFIQCTSPLTSSEDLTNAYGLFLSEKLDSLASVTSGRGGFKCGGFMWDQNGPLFDPKSRKKRQDLPELYLENGAFWIFSAEGLSKQENRLHGKMGMYLMPTIRSFEIDEPEDFEIVTHLMNYGHKKENYEISKNKSRGTS